MKDFDWQEANNHHTPESVAWLKTVFDKPLTEAEFVEQYRDLPHNHPKRSRCRTPSRVKKQYHYLKDTFGFFTA